VALVLAGKALTVVMLLQTLIFQRVWAVVVVVQAKLVKMLVNFKRGMEAMA
jgi:hypothetical protein